MSRNILTQLLFWKYFSKNFLLLLSLFILTLGLFLGNADNLLKRGPNSVVAEENVSVDEQEGFSDYEPSVSVDPQEGFSDYTPSVSVDPQPGYFVNAYVLQEMRECSGSDVVLTRHWSDGRKETVANYGQSPGECGVGFGSGSGNLNPVPPSSSGGGSYTPSAYVLQELRECDGRSVILNRYWSDGRKETVANYGQSPGECGVGFGSGSGNLNPVPPSSSGGGSYTPSAYVLQELRECDGRNVVLNRYWSNGRKETVANYGRSPGECGVGFGSGSSSLSDVPAPSRSDSRVAPIQPYVLQELRECSGNSVVLNRYWSNGRKETVANYGQSPGECGVEFQTASYRLSSVPTSSSTTNTQVYEPTPYVLQEMRECQGSDVILVKYYNNGRREVAANYGQSPGECGVQVPITTNNLVTSNTAGTSTSTAGGLNTATGTIQCPQGYTAQNVNNTIYCVQTAGTATSGSAAPQQQNNIAKELSPAAPQVVSQLPANVAELPRTGIPLVAWGVAALLPLGMKMRKSKQSQEDFLVNSLWIERQMKRD